MKILMQPETKRTFLTKYMFMRWLKKLCKMYSRFESDCLYLIDISNYIYTTAHMYETEVECYAAIFKEEYSDALTMYIYDRTLFTNEIGAYSRPSKNALVSLMTKELAKEGYNSEDIANGKTLLSNIKSVVYAASTDFIPCDMFSGNVFGYTNGIESIVFAKNADMAIGTIEAAAFKGCESLKYITLPENCRKIQDFAFANCASLESLDLRNVLYIGSCAFWQCSGVTRTILDLMINHIGESAFEGCTNLEEVCIATSVGEDVDPEAYMSSVNRTSFSSMNYVDIGDSAFAKCVSLKKMPVVITHCSEISESVCEGCTSMSDIVIGPRVRFINNKAFKDCSSVNTVRFIWNPKTNIYEIGEWAFDLNSDNEITITLPSNVKSIYYNSFSNNVTLTTDDYHTYRMIGNAIMDGDATFKYKLVSSAESMDDNNSEES